MNRQPGGVSPGLNNFYSRMVRIVRTFVEDSTSPVRRTGSPVDMETLTRLGPGTKPNSACTTRRWNVSDPSGHALELETEPEITPPSGGQCAHTGVVHYGIKSLSGYFSTFFGWCTPKNAYEINDRKSNNAIAGAISLVADLLRYTSGCGSHRPFILPRSLRAQKRRQQADDLPRPLRLHPMSRSIYQISDAHVRAGAVLHALQGSGRLKASPIQGTGREHGPNVNRPASESL